MGANNVPPKLSIFQLCAPCGFPVRRFFSEARSRAELCSKKTRRAVRIQKERGGSESAKRKGEIGRGREREKISDTKKDALKNASKIFPK